MLRANFTPRGVAWQWLLPWCLFVLHAALFGDWLIDDAGISFAYGWNLLHGHGLVAQRGVPPVEGFSNPLWTLLVSVLVATQPAAPAVPVKVVSCLLVAVTYFAIARACRLLFPEQWWAAGVTLTTLLFLALCTSFVVWTVSGLENPLYAMLFAVWLWQLLALVLPPDGSSRRRAAAIGLLTAGLALTRPDGILLAAVPPVVVAVAVYQGRLVSAAAVRCLPAYALAFLLPTAAYFIFRWLYFGAWLPNTHLAKGGPNLASFLSVFLLGRSTVEKTYSFWHGVFSWRAGWTMLVALAAALHLLAKRRRESPLLLLLPPAVCAWASFCLLPPDWMGEFRFATLLLMCLPLALATLAAELLSSATLSARQGKLWFQVFAAALLLHSAIVYVPRSRDFAAAPTVPLAHVAHEQGALFNYYAAELGIDDASLLCADQGGTLMFSRLRVYDLAGLCDPTFARLTYATDKRPLQQHLRALRPTFLHLDGVWAERSGFYADAELRTLYVPLREYPNHWAAEQSRQGVRAGDYVLKAAVAGANAAATLPRLQQRLRATPAGELHVPAEFSQPFPRG